MEVTKQNKTADFFFGVVGEEKSTQNHLNETNLIQIQFLLFSVVVTVPSMINDLKGYENGNYNTEIEKWELNIWFKLIFCSIDRNHSEFHQSESKAELLQRHRDELELRFYEQVQKQCGCLIFDIIARVRAVPDVLLLKLDYFLDHTLSWVSSVTLRYRTITKKVM